MKRLIVAFALAPAGFSALAEEAPTLRCGRMSRDFFGKREACYPAFLPAKLPDMESPLSKDFIDLRECFPKSVSQGDDGTCYSFSAAALMESAMRRRDGRTPKLAEEDFMAYNFLQMNSPAPLNKRHGSALRRLSKKTRPEGVFDGGWPAATIQAALTKGYVNVKDSRWSDPSAQSFSKVATVIGATTETIQYLRLQQGDASALEDDAVRVLAKQQLERKPDALPTQGIGIKNYELPKTITEASKKLGGKLATAAFVEKRILGLRESVNTTQGYVASSSNAESRAKQMEYLRRFEGWLTEAEREYSSNRAAYEECYQAAKPLLEWILAELCAGRSVGLAVSPLSVRIPSEYKTAMTTSTIGGLHALVAVGAGYDAASKEPYLLLRDSGSLSAPTGWLPFSRACRIFQAHSLVVWKVDPTDEMDGVNW